jgi:glycosyltransferase EpsF
VKILFAVNSGNPGGVEQHILDLTKGLIAEGYAVYIVCLEGPIVDWYQNAGAKVIKLKLRFEIDPIYIFALVKILRKEKIDVVHAHELKAGVNSLIAAYVASVKVRVTHIHTPMSEWRVNDWAKKLYTHAEIFFYSTLVNLLAGKEIALTPSRKRIKAKEGVALNKIEVIPNGLDFSLFSADKNTRLSNRQKVLSEYCIPNERIVIGNIGRMTEEKGHDVLIRAFDKVARDPEFADKVHLLLAGGGKLEAQNRGLVKTLGLENKVSITGVFDNDDKVKYYTSFDVFIFPSLAEGFGIVLVEAMSMGLPVISSDLEVLKEVSGGNVINFRTGDATDLAGKVQVVLRDLDKSKEYAASVGRRYVLENYSLEKFVQNYIRLYENLNAR